MVLGSWVSELYRGCDDNVQTRFYWMGCIEAVLKTTSEDQKQQKAQCDNTDTD